MDDELLPDRPPPPLTWRDVVDRFVPTERWQAARWITGALALVVLAGATWWALRPPPVPATELSLPYAPGAGGPGGTGLSAASTSTSTTGPAEVEVLVHAAGAVASPGVHRLPAGSRVADLLAAAGGPTADADLDRVNLAAPLADGERVWFPRVGEEVPPAVAGGPASATGRGASGSAGPIDLNAATADELEALPGIGPSIAAAIVEHRERHGPFAAVDELLEVPGIGPARLEEIRPFVTV